MISVVVFKWKAEGYRSKFTGHHVNVMRNMVRRYYPHSHRFICVTDDPSGIDSGIEIVPLWDDHAEVKNPTWAHGPHCYRRLKVFSPEFEQIAGERFVCIDLDCVITGDLSPLWNRPEDFVIFASLERVGMKHGTYNGSMFMMTAGARRQVWERFDPSRSPQLAHRAGFRGSDQGWINYCLGTDEARWTWNDGVYPYRAYVMSKKKGRLPEDARVVVFWGQPDPWMPEALALSPWIKDHWQ
jgi:hypothetical protein